MTESTDLDSHRGMAAQRATEKRRRGRAVEKDQLALRDRREEMERYLFSAPSAGWAEAVDKARYLLLLLARDSSDPRARKMVGAVLQDFERLLGDTPAVPAEGDDRP